MGEHRGHLAHRRQPQVHEHETVILALHSFHGQRAPLGDIDLVTSALENGSRKDLLGLDILNQEHTRWATLALRDRYGAALADGGCCFDLGLAPQTRLAIALCGPMRDRAAVR